MVSFLRPSCCEVGDDHRFRGYPPRMGKTELKIQIDSELLAQAQEAGLSVEALAEAGVRRALAGVERFQGLAEDEKAFLWAEENAEAIAAQRERIASYGIFGEDLRTW